MAQREGSPYYDIPADTQITTIHNPESPTLGFQSGNFPWSHASTSIRPQLIRRNCGLHAEDEPCYAVINRGEVDSQGSTSMIPVPSGSSREWRADRPEFRPTVSRRRSCSRERESETNSSSSSSSRSHSSSGSSSSSMQRYPSFSRQRSRSRSHSRARTIASRSDEASPPVPVVPAGHLARVAVPPSNEADPDVPEGYHKPGRPSTEDSGVYVTFSGATSSRTGRSCVRSTTSAVGSSIASSIPRGPTLNPMPAAVPAQRLLALPEAAVPQRHIDFDASCSSRPKPCRIANSGLVAKVKNAIHSVDRSFARFISHRKDKKYCRLQRQRELKERKALNKRLDANNKHAISSHLEKEKRRHALMKEGMKAQKWGLKRCKKMDRRARKEAEWRDKIESTQRKVYRGPLGKVVDGMFEWRLKLDAWVKMPWKNKFGPKPQPWPR